MYTPVNHTQWAEPPETALHFTPYAWAKIKYLCDYAKTEVGGYGIAEDQNDLLLVTDVVLPKQECSAASVKFDDEGVADHFELMCSPEIGLSPNQFMRIWIHTHPGISATPSSVDEETFDKVLGDCNWSVMFIMAKEGQTYARLQFRDTIRDAHKIGVDVDWYYPFLGSQHAAWEKEHDDKVTAAAPMVHARQGANSYLYGNPHAGHIVTAKNKLTDPIELDSGQGAVDPLGQMADDDRQWFENYLGVEADIWNQKMAQLEADKTDNQQVWPDPPVTFGDDSPADGGLAHD